MKRKISPFARKRYQRRYGRELGVTPTKFTGPNRNIGLRTADELAMIAGGQFAAERALDILDIDQVDSLGDWLGITGLTLLGGAGGLAAQRALLAGGKVALQTPPLKYLDRAKKSPLTQSNSQQDINVLDHYTGDKQEQLRAERLEEPTVEEEINYHSNSVVKQATDINDIYQLVLDQSGIIDAKKYNQISEEIAEQAADHDSSGTGGTFKK